MSQHTTYRCVDCRREVQRSAVKAFYRRTKVSYRFDDITLRCECGGEIDVIPDPRVMIFDGQQNESHRDNVIVHLIDGINAVAEQGLLPPSNFSLQKSAAEFTWGYSGTGPHSLAHSLLAFVYDDQIADHYYHQFTWTVVAGWDQQHFTITSDQIISWLDMFQADVAWTQQNGRANGL